MRTSLLSSCTLLALALTPLALAAEFPANKLFVGSSGNARINVYDEAGNLTGSIGATSLLQDATDIAFGPDGKLYAACAATNRVYAFAEDDTLMATIGAAGGLSSPGGLAFGPDGNLFVTDGTTNSVIVFDGDTLLESPFGTVVDTFGLGVGLDTPTDIVFSADGHALVASSASGRIHVFDASGTKLREIGSGSPLASIGGMALSVDGRLYVSSQTTNSVLVFNPDGTQAGVIGFGSGLDTPGGLAFGPDSNLYVVSQGTDEVLVFDFGGQVVSQFGDTLSGPTRLAFAPYRFRFSAKGTLVRDGELQAKIKQEGVISIQPGSQGMMLTFEPPKKGESLLNTFGAAALVLPGYEAFEDLQDKKRTFYGGWIPDAASDEGIASLTLSVSGKVNKDNGFFEVKNAKGTLLRAGSDGVFIGSAKSAKRLD